MARDKHRTFLTENLVRIKVAGEWYGLFSLPDKEVNDLELGGSLTIFQDEDKGKDVIIRGTEDLFRVRVADPEAPDDPNRSFVLVGPVSSIEAYHLAD